MCSIFCNSSCLIRLAFCRVVLDKPQRTRGHPVKDGCHVCRWKRTRATLAILPIYNLSERNKWGKRNLTVGWQLTGYRPFYGLVELQVYGFYSFQVSFGARRKSERDRFPSFIIPKGKEGRKNTENHPRHSLSDRFLPDDLPIRQQLLTEN